MAFRRRLLGLLFVALIVALCGLSVAAYLKVFTTRVTVLLRTDHVGNQLQVDSDVKLLGVQVGQVGAVRTRGSGAEVELSMRPEEVGRIPANVSARLLPKTLFGERFVSLELPDDPAGALGEGAVIEQDRTSSAIEVERVFNDLLPTLQAVRPDKLSATLSAMAQALDGRGATLGETITELDAYLRELNPQLPVLKQDITRFADLSGVYADAGPDIVQALKELTTTSRTIAQQRADLDAVYTSLTTAAADLTAFFKDHGENFVGLSDRSRPTLELLATYSPSFPCVLVAVNDLRPRMDQVLGKGTDQPGMHANVTVVPPGEKYVPGRDDPVIRRGGTPHCPAGPVNAVAPDRVPGWAGLLMGVR
ncbi:hypothetical protein SUDANB95_03968 [Actinosynnema sp. ALI-1.44]